MTVGAVAFDKIKQAGYNAITLCVLLHLIETARTGGYITQTQAEIAEELGTTRESVSRAITRLRKDGHIYREGPVNVLSPLTACTGSGKEHQDAFSRMPEKLRPTAEVRHLQPVS